ncbi:MAG: hypothetical protein FWG57_01930 [Endomicrobia bacterium]|nr:hypothetical protein [Endomicrobiia bacterium]
MRTDNLQKNFFIGSFAVLFFVMAIMILTDNLSAGAVYLHAALFVLCFIAALSNLYIIRKNGGGWNFAWITLSIIFLFMIFNAKLMLYDKIRSIIFNQYDMTMDYAFWVDKTNYIFVDMLFLAVIAAPLIIGEIKKSKLALSYFIAAIAFTALAVTINLIGISGLGAAIQNFYDIFWKVSEATALLLFLNSFFCSAVTVKASNK